MVEKRGIIKSSLLPISKLWSTLTKHLGRSSCLRLGYASVGMEIFTIGTIIM